MVHEQCNGVEAACCDDQVMLWFYKELGMPLRSGYVLTFTYLEKKLLLTYLMFLLSYKHLIVIIVL